MITNAKGLVIIVLVLLIHLRFNCNAKAVLEYCPQLPDKTLTIILGSAFNPRYMSIVQPDTDSSQSESNSGYKRESYEESFFVDDTYEQELSEKPAWEVDHISEVSQARSRRQVKDEPKRDIRRAFLDRVSSPRKEEIFKSRPWECKAQIRWMDLGADYFPRYIRSVECTKKECWYGHYTCKPRSFTIKVLRRKSGQCARISQRNIMISMDGVTGEFTELWVWEEKAVNFCCDCVMTY